MDFCFIRLFTAGTTGCVGCTYIICLLFTFSCFGLLLGICNDQYDWLRWSYCYLLVYYLLLAVLVFYSVFVTIYTTSFAGHYLSFFL